MHQEAFDADTILAGVLAKGCMMVRQSDTVTQSNTHKTPRIQMDIDLFRLVSGRMTAGSLPPSSRVTGVIWVVAACRTLRPTVSLPMNVMCLKNGVSQGCQAE